MRNSDIIEEEELSICSEKIEDDLTTPQTNLFASLKIPMHYFSKQFTFDDMCESMVSNTINTKKDDSSSFNSSGTFERKGHFHSSLNWPRPKSNFGIRKNSVQLIRSHDQINEVRKISSVLNEKEIEYKMMIKKYAQCKEKLRELKRLKLKKKEEYELVIKGNYTMKENICNIMGFKS